MIENQVFENWNLDLIQGLYKGSPAETWENLNLIAEIRPAHLTCYQGRFADRPQGDCYNKEPKYTSFKDEPATLLGRCLFGRKWLHLDVTRATPTDSCVTISTSIRIESTLQAMAKSAHQRQVILLWVGAASYSHISTKAMKEDCRGYMFRNESNIRSYVDCVLPGNIPIAAGRIIDQEELLATSYATGLRNGRIEDDDLRSIRERT